MSIIDIPTGRELDTVLRPLVRRQFRVRGIVQGVGFRPFVYNLAATLGLRGYVLNSSAGVVIEVEGPEFVVDHFLGALTTQAPPLARIENVSTSELKPIGDQDFVIRESVEAGGSVAAVPADVATCDDCQRELTNPVNRRFHYPFTNCTNCGPRYSIIQEVPYDRPATTMAKFQMCPACRAEYENPRNRRFHAQPNACPECGPGLALISADGDCQPAAFRGSSYDSAQILAEVRRQLHEGKILAIKGLGGFHLACDAENDVAVRRLRARKRRSDKPFALMTPSLAAAEEICVLYDADRQALTSARRPIVILPHRPGTRISPAVAPNNATLGVMLPYTPLHHLLFGGSRNGASDFTALVMTSGNLSEEPIVMSNDGAPKELHSLADTFLFHNRDIHTRVDDSIVRIFEGKERLLRRARGYAPHAFDLDEPLHAILGCGAELKSTLCLTTGHHAILSQHLGDLENFETLEFYEETLAKLKRLFRVEPRFVAYDLHPQYISTRLALEMPGVDRIGVQHHHAHIASCMAENHLRDRVIGVAMDGTGYGTDGKIWGGEFLVADRATFERRAHLRYVPLPGADAAIRQPWRSALTHLLDAYGEAPLPRELPLWNAIPAKSIRLVQTMIQRGINTVHTSSCGRLFDAVASIVGLRHEINFEGQAAMELETAAAAGVEEAYPFEVAPGELWTVDTRPMIRAIVGETLAQVPVEYISARFHNTLAEMFADVCTRIRERDQLNRVCLSGGTFQNMALLERATRDLRLRGFKVFLHALVPPNDGGIALGQVVVANEILRRREQNVSGHSR